MNRTSRSESFVMVSIKKLGATFLLVAWFAPIAAAQTVIDGVTFVDRGTNGQITLGAFAGGLSVLDYDRDGYMDLVICQNSGSFARLFRNVPDAARPGFRNFVNVTTGSGLDQTDGAGNAASALAPLVADYDNDGDSDIYIMGLRSGQTLAGYLYRNDGGTFTNVSAASGIRYSGDIPESASWADYDLDGNTDLLVVNRGTPGSTRPLRLFRNNGDGTFSDASSAMPNLSGWSRCYAHTWSDPDGDGDMDAMLIPSSGGPFLLRNDEGAGGLRTFVNVAAASGFTRTGPAPMGISGADFDRDGDFDIALTNGAVGVYYRNDGGTLIEIFPFATFWGWGIIWFDVDNDADLDHYQAGSYLSGANHNRLVRSSIAQGGTIWTDISPALNDAVAASQHAAQIDISGDGRQDLVTVNPGSFISIEENQSTATGNWIKILARGDGGQVSRDALGTVVRVISGGATPVTQSHLIVSGASTASTEDPRIHFGLGPAASANRVEITWAREGPLASRTDVFFGPFPAGQIVTLYPRCTGDFNHSGAADSQDFFDFVAAFFSASSAADFNASGAVNSQDFFDFLAAFFGGCQ